MRELASPPVTLALVGAGTQARWQARAIATATDLEAIRVYSPSDSRVQCSRTLAEELDCSTESVESARAAVTGADVVVTATTATSPVVPGDALVSGSVVVAVGSYSPAMQEIDTVTVRRADRVYADVSTEAAIIGDIAARS